MSISYAAAIAASKNYQGNVVVQIGANYFAQRQPDSGLSISYPYSQSVGALTLNANSVDPRRVSTTVASFSFKLVDISGIISALVKGDSSTLVGQAVSIWLGRTGIGQDFSDYFALPITYILGLDHTDAGYTISSTELTNQIDKTIYNFNSALAVDILIGTTIWTMRDDLSTFPSSGIVKVDDEFASYSGIDLVNNRLTGVIRGVLNSTPDTHSAFTNCAFVEDVTDNPLSILLKLLISKGGGGTYDVLQSGCGLADTLIDVAGIEALRDSLFIGVSYNLTFYTIDSALTLIENDILMPNNLRFTYNSLNSKLTVAILDKAEFVDDDSMIDESTLTKFPEWNVDGSTITNYVTVEWDWSEALQVFQAQDTYTNDDSIAAYGQQNPLDFQFKGPKALLGGQALVDDFGTRFVGRLSVPSPTISVTTQIDKSLQNIGDKTYLTSSRVPAADGSLNFSSDLEVISRQINQTNGEAQFKLAYTSYTNIRSGFIAPSDSVVTVISQKSITVGLSRGSYYKVGWVMKLWDTVAQAYTADAANTIQSISGDTVTFTNNFTTTLGTRYKIRFADYNSTVATQKRYASIAPHGSNFDDGQPSYKVTF